MRWSGYKLKRRPPRVRLFVGGSIQTQNDIAIRANANPVNPCMNPAKMAPRIKNSQVIKLQLWNTWRYCSEFFVINVADWANVAKLDVKWWIKHECLNTADVHRLPIEFISISENALHQRGVLHMLKQVALLSVVAVTFTGCVVGAIWWWPIPFESIWLCKSIWLFRSIWLFIRTALWLKSALWPFIWSSE